MRRTPGKQIPVFVVISVVFIWHEIRQGNKLTKAANVQALTELSSPFNMQLIQDRQLAEFWYKGANQFDTMDETNQQRYTGLVTWWLILHENIYYQYTKGLIDEDFYAGWSRDLEIFVKMHNLGRHWESMRNYYQDAFAKHVNELIQKAQPAPGVNQAESAKK
jgi:hypothetical protein